MIRLPPLGQGTQMPLTGYIKLPPLVGSQPSIPKPDLSFSSPIQTPPVNLLGGTETSTPVIAPGPTNFLKTAGKAILNVIKNPTQILVGAGEGAISATLGVAQGLTNLVGVNALSERIKQNKDYLNQVVRDNVAPKQDQKTAFTIGQFVGEQLPYVLASEATAGIVNPITAEALSKTDITLKAASTIGKLTKAASNAAGFIGLDQITHTPEEGSRAQSVMKDLLVLGTLEGLGVGLGKLGDIKALKDTRAYLETIKTTKPPLAEIEAKVTQLTTQIKTETGKSPQELIATAIKQAPDTPTISSPGVPTLIESPKVQVTRTQLPVGTGDVKTSRLEARIKGKLDNLSEADRQNISTYNQMNKKDQITQAVKYVTKNPDDAMKVLRGEKPAPKGLLNNSIFLAMEEHANIGNDSELSLKLASLRSTRLGQEISILTERDPNSAVKYLSDIQTRRIEALGREKFASLKNQELGNIKRAISIPRLQKTDWNAFIDSIRC